MPPSYADPGSPALNRGLDCRTRVESALPPLVAGVSRGGEGSERGAQAAAGLGARGPRAVQARTPRVAPGLRRRIAGALAAAGTASAETAAVDALQDTDPGVVDAATRSLIGNVPSLSPSHRKALADHLLQLLGNKKTHLPLASEAAVVRLL